MGSRDPEPAPIDAAAVIDQACREAWLALLRDRGFGFGASAYYDRIRLRTLLEVRRRVRLVVSGADFAAAGTATATAGAVSGSGETEGPESAGSRAGVAAGRGPLPYSERLEGIRALISGMLEDVPALLAFERDHPGHGRGKPAAIWRAYGVQPGTYYQALNRAIDRPEALAADAVLTVHLLRQRAERKAVGR